MINTVNVYNNNVGDVRQRRTARSVQTERPKIGPNVRHFSAASPVSPPSTLRAGPTCRVGRRNRPARPASARSAASEQRPRTVDLRYAQPAVCTLHCARPPAGRITTEKPSVRLLSFV